MGNIDLQADWLNGGALPEFCVMSLEDFVHSGGFDKTLLDSGEKPYELHENSPGIIRVQGWLEGNDLISLTGWVKLDQCFENASLNSVRSQNLGDYKPKHAWSIIDKFSERSEGLPLSSWYDFVQEATCDL